MADNITTIRYEDKEITPIGTAHVLHESVELVKQTIDNLLPDTICIELDDERYKNLQNPKAWENTNIADVIKSKKVGLLLVNIILSSYQKPVAKTLGTTPGQEMLQGIESAKEHSCEKDNLEAAISSIGEEFPKIAEILINERDQHLAYKIKTAPGEKLLLLSGRLMLPEYKKKYFVNRT